MPGHWTTWAVSTLAEPLLGHRAYVVEADQFTGTISLRSNSPGPAGSLVVEFDGVTLGLDAADPSLVNFIDVHDGSASTPASPEPSLLHRLIGEQAGAALVAFAAQHDNRPHRVDSTDGGREQPVPSRIARLATALAGADGPGLLQEEAALALLEGFSIAQHVGLMDDLPGSHARFEQAAVAVSRLSESQILRMDRRTRADAADVCEVAAERADDYLAEGLRDVSTRLRDVATRGVRAASAMPPHKLSVDPSVQISHASLPALIAEITPSVTRTTNDEFQVRLHGWAGRTDGWWVRAFRAGGQVPLAAVPMRSVGLDAVAELLLPQRDGATFEIDIVDDPGSARPSTQLAAFRAAIAAGQRAARLERLDRRDAAAHAWQRSSELHGQAGDDDRARQADAIVSDQRATSLARRSLQVAPTLADHFLPS